jgi:hypothetical protein
VIRKSLFIAASAASLLLCVGTVTYSRMARIDQLRFNRGRSSYAIAAEPGRVTFFCEKQRQWTFGDCFPAGFQRWSANSNRSGDANSVHQAGYWGDASMQPGTATYHQAAGFGVYAFNGVAGPQSINLLAYAVELPCWLLESVAALLPIQFTVRSFRRRRLAQHDRCRNCSYNLTGNTSGVCPECGNVIASR